ncbi:prolipoprotein diacylglyceryl transferase [Pedobacter yulinensis]|nr:hypothetical protein [Pedobacter yulinensis]
MENQDQNKEQDSQLQQTKANGQQNDARQSEEAFRDPAPTDDVQLEIETVVPDDHTKGVARQAGTPGETPSSSGTEAEQPEKSEGQAAEVSREEGSQVTGQETASDAADQEDAVPSTEEPVQDKPGEDADEQPADSGNEETSKKDDSGNGIETVAP